jgi:adenosine deaminase
MTHEYLRAVEDQNLSYVDLKRMARQSLEHSFIPGVSLWNDGHELHRTSACENDKALGDRVSGKCAKFLEANERARVQWQLEKAFADFEEKF